MPNTIALAITFKEFFNWNRARINCIIPLLLAMIQLGTVNLAKMAQTFPGTAKVDSHYKRLQRLFREFRLELDLVAQFLAHLLPLDEWILTLDRTNWKLGKINLNFLVLGVAYRGIAFPLFWPTLDKKGNSNTSERISLIDRFIAVFGLEKVRCLVADREFIGRKWFSYLIEKNILFRIRIKHNTLVATTRGGLVPVKNLFRDLQPGTYKILPGMRNVWGLQLYIIGLKMANGEFVILVTQDQPETALEDYKERWQIETLFSCLKTRGFCLEETHLTHQDRLEKLFAFLAIAFCWAHLTGEWLNEVKPLKLKKHGRLAKSLFRYGLDYLRNILFNKEEPTKQQAFQQALENFLKRFNRVPQGTLAEPLRLAAIG